MFSPKFMNYIIDHSGENKTPVNKFPVQLDDQITKEVSLLKNETNNTVNNLKSLILGLKNRVCSRNKA